MPFKGQVTEQTTVKMVYSITYRYKNKEKNYLYNMRIAQLPILKNSTHYIESFIPFSVW